jgi:predicted Kef-type K+ transport protein
MTWSTILLVALVGGVLPDISRPPLMGQVLLGLLVTPLTRGFVRSVFR